ncbi:hypothetical protein ACJIZ3_002071 [Penstemon smallii]|uniref:Dof-type domain-containing protein n=1 Tax=Penstemon smallii TaxID=265156 RepID=A0ABD3U942_9LAMI
MSTELKDPKIKLFGKTIELPETSSSEAVAETGGAGSTQSSDESNQNSPSSSNSMLEDCNSDGGAEELDSHMSLSNPEQTMAKEGDQAQDLTSEELKESNVNPSINEDSKPLPTDSDAGVVKTSKSEEESNSEEKTLKKPDKLLPCPRCNSMDTKFCYFNNYNVNQPRHFCKKCQRYWTAGGTMRNVPVGAGRRKNKNASSQFHDLTVPEVLQGARIDLPNGIHHPVLKPNGTVLTFSSDTPLSRNGYHQPEDLGISVSHGSKENGDDHSCGSSITAASSKDEIGKIGLPELMPNCHPFPQQVHCFPGGPWPYPWGFPMPLYPTGPPYWACAMPGNWNVPWVIPSAPTDSQRHTPPRTGPSSPILGKHSRDENVPKPANKKEDDQRNEINSGKCLWIPKTLRIDDPREAAKSSIWTTLGIKNDRVHVIGGGGLFKAFDSKSKVDEKTHVLNTSAVLQANPAALSRSLNFHESL